MVQVSNLTLMALGESFLFRLLYKTKTWPFLIFSGSSAPEILLSVIEIFANNFEAGDLGPRQVERRKEQPNTYINLQIFLKYHCWQCRLQSVHHCRHLHYGQS
jgi:hypothetical protein